MPLYGLFDIVGFFWLLVSVTGELSGRLVASWSQKKWNRKWMEILVENEFFHFIPHFDMQPNTYSSISIVNTQNMQYCYSHAYHYNKSTFFFYSCKIYSCVICPWWKVIEAIDFLPLNRYSRNSFSVFLSNSLPQIQSNNSNYFLTLHRRQLSFLLFNYSYLGAQ